MTGFTWCGKMTRRGVSAGTCIATLAMMAFIAGCPNVMTPLSVTLGGCPDTAATVGDEVALTITVNQAAAEVTVEVTSGNGSVAVSDDGGTATVTATGAGDVTVTATAVNGDETDTDTCTITFEVAAGAPTVELDASPATVAGGGTVDLTCTDTDAENPSDSFAITQTAGDGGELADNGDGTATFTAPDLDLGADDASFTFSCTGTNDAGTSAASTANVTVTAPVEEVVIGAPDSGTEVNIGDSIELSVDTSNIGTGGGEGDTFTFDWSADDANVTFDCGANDQDPDDDLDTDCSTISMTIGAGAGDFTVTVSVTRNSDNMTFTDTIDFTIAVSPDFAVSFTGCPADTVADDTAIDLTVATANSSGDRVDLSYEVTGAGSLSGDDDETPETVTFTTGNTDGTLTVTAQDIMVTINDNGTPDDDTDDFEEETVLAEATATCSFSVSVETSLTVNAGANRTFNTAADAGAFDFTQQISSNGGSGNDTLPTAITAIATDPQFENAQLAFEWEIVDVPSGMDLDDVIITNSASSTLSFIIIPNPTATFETLNADATTNEVSGVIVPGTYTFRITVTNPNGDTAFDDIDLVLTAQIDFTADGNDVAGMTPASLSVTHHILCSGASTDLAFVLRAINSGNIVFLLDDRNVNTDARADQALNTVAVEGMDPIESENIAATVTSENKGTYDLNARFDSGEASQTKQATGVTVSVQPTIPSAVDLDTPDGTDLSSSAAPRFGQVNSTATGDAGGTAEDQETGLAGAHEGAVTTLDGAKMISADVNDDGFNEAVIVDTDNQNIRFVTGFGEDPNDSTVSPINNGINVEDGIFTAAAVLFTIDVGAADVTDIATCDFDGDSHTDLIVGRGLVDEGTTANSLEGSVRVYYNVGTTNGNVFGTNPYTVTAVNFNRADSGNANLDHLFGYSVACGDFNGDGIDDIIAGAPGDDNGTPESGRVWVIPGNGIRYTGNIVVDDARANIANVVEIGDFGNPITTTAGDLFGISVAVADLNGDGRADVIAGAPGFEGSGTGTPANAGAVFQINGTTNTGVISTATKKWEGDVANLFFGRKVALGDFDGNGSMDVVVSACIGADKDPDVGEDFRGELTVILNANGVGSFDSDDSTIDGLPSITGDNADTNLGAAVSLADFNGDGFDDILAYGPSNTDAREELVYIAGSASPSTTLTATSTLSSASDTTTLVIPVTPSAQATGTQMGATGVLYITGFCGFADVNGDGTVDMFWSESGNDVGALFGCTN